MDERAKSATFVDVKDSPKYSENIWVERVYESKHILFRRPTFEIMSLPSRFQEAESTRSEINLNLFLDAQASLAPTHVSPSVRDTFKFPFYHCLWLLYVKS